MDRKSVFQFTDIAAMAHHVGRVALPFAALRVGPLLRPYLSALDVGLKFLRTSYYPGRGVLGEIESLKSHVDVFKLNLGRIQRRNVELRHIRKLLLHLCTLRYN